MFIIHCNELVVHYSLHTIVCQLHLIASVQMVYYIGDDFLYVQKVTSQLIFLFNCLDTEYMFHKIHYISDGLLLAQQVTNQ